MISAETKSLIARAKQIYADHGDLLFPYEVVGEAKPAAEFVTDPATGSMIVETAGRKSKTGASLCPCLRPHRHPRMRP